MTNPQSIVKESINIREELVNTLSAVQRTPLALLMMIILQRQELEDTLGKMTSAKLHQWFNTCDWSKNSERPSANLIDNANAIWNKFKADPTILEAVQQSETMFGNQGPFRSVLQMYLICLKAGKDAKKLKWLCNIQRWAMIQDRTSEATPDPITPMGPPRTASRDPESPL